MKYKKLGTIKKAKGLQIWEFDFDYSLIDGEQTDVFVVAKSKSRKTKPTAAPPM